MQGLQMHYTSCRRGHSGSAGFQTRALSPGIRPEEQREIERRGVYRPPRDAAQEPSQDQLEREFPVALRYYPLETGRWAMTCSRYTGRDYSGRWGNFFAHTLVLPRCIGPSSWPIDFFEWQEWQTGLSPEQDTDGEPPELPEIELTPMESESFQLEDLRDFLKENEGRPPLLARMARAVLLGRGNSRSLVIRDTALNNLYWIACLQKIFPPRHAARLSLSTYQEDPRGCADINATCGETSFTFSESERYYQFYMFDLVDDVASEVPESEQDFPAMAARSLAEKPSDLALFHEFMDLFDHQEVDDDLTAAFHLFQLSRAREFAPAGERLGSMIRFAARYATPEGRPPLLEIFARSLEDLGGLRDPQDYEGVVCFLADGAKLTGEADDRELAFRTWLQLVDGHVCSAPGRDQEHTAALGVADATWNYLLSMLPDASAQLAALVMNPRRWQSFRHPTDAGLCFLLRVGWHSLEFLERRPVWEQSEIRDLVGELIGRGEPAPYASMALEAVPQSPDALIGLSRLAASGVLEAKSSRSKVEVGKALGGVLAGCPNRIALETRKRLEDVEDDWYLLYGEWLQILDSSSRPIEAFHEYRRTVLTDVPRYASDGGLDWTVESLLDRLESENLEGGAELATNWLQSGDLNRFCHDQIHRCLELVNAGLPLDLKKREAAEIARDLSRAATTHLVNLRPDRPRLLRAMAAIQECRQLYSEDLAGFEEACQDISDSDYRRFLDAFLPPALALTKSRKDHEEVVMAVFQAAHRSTFHRAYLGLLGQDPKKTSFPTLLAALKFWLAVDGRTKAGKALAPIEEEATKKLVKVLSRLSAKRYQQVEKNLGKLKSGKEADRWRALQKRVSEYEERPLAKIRQLLPRVKSLFFRK